MKFRMCPDRRTDPRGFGWQWGYCYRCADRTGRKDDADRWSCEGSHRWQKDQIPDDHWKAVQVLTRAGML